MFATARTPTKKNYIENTEKHTTTIAFTKEKESIEEMEIGKLSPTPTISVTETDSSKTKANPTKRQNSKDKPDNVEDGASHQSQSQQKYGGNRVAEARACLNKAKMQLASSKNLRTDIKETMIAAVDRLFQLVKEAEAERKARPIESPHECVKAVESHPSIYPLEQNDALLKALEENKQLIKENSRQIEDLHSVMNNYQKTAATITYASVVAGATTSKPTQQPPLHSVVITSEDTTVSGEEILQNIRKAVDARAGDVIIDRIRKGKDKKVIIGCREVTDLKKVTDRIKEKGHNLQVAEVKNKDPQIVLYSVLASNTDEEIVESLRKQNKHLLKDINNVENKIEVRYRRKARNPLTAHIVLTVSPLIWQKLTQAGTVIIDLQRIKVADQSPLIQCSHCLGYGHGRRYCEDSVDACSHCGGKHLKAQCPKWMSDAPPSCINCVKAKLHKTEHNAFDGECPVRKKWEILARSSVAYS